MTATVTDGDVRRPAQEITAEEEEGPSEEGGGKA